jgi:hypothetical protein
MVDVSELRIATPLPVSETNPVALELPAVDALNQCPEVIRRLPDGSIWLSAPTKGASSKSTKRTRCEWKEDGYWYLTSATKHWSRQTMVLTKVNSALKVVIGQIHVKDANTPPLKVFWNKGKITLGFRQNFDNPEIVNSVLHPNVPLGTTFKLSIGVTHTGYISVNVLVPGSDTVSAKLWMDTSWRDQLLQFHGGLYNQVDYTEDTLPYDGSESIISDLVITH